MLVEILLVPVLALCWWMLSYQSKFQKMYKKIPGPTPYPILGNVLEFNYPKEEITETLKKLASRYGPVYRFMLGQEPMVCISSPELVEKLHINSYAIMDKGSILKHYHPLMGEGLFTSDGEKWKKQRKLLAPAFNVKILETFIPVFEKNSAMLVENMLKKSETEFDVVPLVSSCSFDIICETAMGYKSNTQQETSIYFETFNELKSILLRRIMSFLGQSFLYNILPSGRRFKKLLLYFHSVTENIINEGKLRYSKSLHNNDSDGNIDGTSQARLKRKPFLDLMLEYNLDGAGLTDRELRDQVNTFMATGHDTVHAQICFALYCLSQYPQVQDKAYEEVMQILGDSDKDATFQDLQNMKYLEKVINETMRLYPISPFIARKATEDIDLMNGFIIPKNASVLVLLEVMNHDPMLHPDPMKFDPERFERKDFHPYSFIPFATGIRSCIGQRFAMLEMKSVISRVLRKFRLSPSDIPLDIKFTIVQKSSEVHLRIESR